MQPYKRYSTPPVNPFVVLDQLWQDDPGLVLRIIFKRIDRLEYVNLDTLHWYAQYWHEGE